MDTLNTKPLVIVRGAGDLASGMAICLHRAGFSVLMTELSQPMAIRTQVSFAQAVYDGSHTISGVEGVLCHSLSEIRLQLAAGKIAIMVTESLAALKELNAIALVDGRMLKNFQPYALGDWPLIIGAGPGFEPGVNCHYAIETNRGPELGRLLVDRSPQPDTGEPAMVEGKTRERVYFAPRDGLFKPQAKIGDLVQEGDLLFFVGDEAVKACFSGVLRGMLHEGLWVKKGQKLADVDPRPEKYRAFEPSDKALRIGASVAALLIEKTFGYSLEGLLRGITIFGSKTLAVVGSGGKSTLLALLARELPGTVLLSTTTKLGEGQSSLAQTHLALTATESPGFDLDDGVKSLLVTGPLQGEKWTAPSPRQLEDLKAFSQKQDAWLVLEADGSKCRPLKAPAEFEPVIPDLVEVVIVLVGLSGIDQPISADWVHRPERFARIAGKREGETICLEDILKVLSSKQGGLKGVPETARVIALLNQADFCTLSPEAEAQVKTNLHAAGYSFVWLGNLATNP